MTDEKTTTPPAASEPTRPKHPLDRFGGVFVCAATCGSIHTIPDGAPLELPAEWTYLGNYGEVVCSDECRTSRLRHYAKEQDPSWTPPDADAVKETREGKDQLDQADMGVTNVADVVRASIEHVSSSAERWLDKQLEKVSDK